MPASVLAVLFLLHLLTAVIWVGGMFFAYMALRPAAMLLEPPQRLQLWRKTFALFFPWVWLSVLTLVITGFGIAHGAHLMEQRHVLLMLLLGLIMIAIFAFIYFVPFRKLKSAVDAEDYPAAGAQLALVRRFIGVNLVLGLVVVAVAGAGRYGVFVF